MLAHFSSLTELFRSGSSAEQRSQELRASKALLIRQLQVALRAVLQNIAARGDATTPLTSVSPGVQQLLALVEACIAHGLKPQTHEAAGSAAPGGGEYPRDGWDFVCSLRRTQDAVCSATLDMIAMTTRVRSSYGRCRAWVRQVVNQHALEYNLRMLTHESNADVVKTWYYETALLAETESAGLFVSMMSALNEIGFELAVDDAALEAVVPTETVCVVSGGGSKDANAEFRPRGMKDGVARYESAGGKEIFRTQIRAKSEVDASKGPLKRWFVGDPVRKVAHYYTQSSTNQPPFDGWLVHPSGGTGPVPKVVTITVPAVLYAPKKAEICAQPLTHPQQVPPSEVSGSVAHSDEGGASKSYSGGGGCDSVSSGGSTRSEQAAARPAVASTAGGAAVASTGSAEKATNATVNDDGHTRESTSDGGGAGAGGVGGNSLLDSPSSPEANDTVRTSLTPPRVSMPAPVLAVDDQAPFDVPPVVAEVDTLHTTAQQQPWESASMARGAGALGITVSASSRAETSPGSGRSTKRMKKKKKTKKRKSRKMMAAIDDDDGASFAATGRATAATYPAAKAPAATRAVSRPEQLHRDRKDRPAPQEQVHDLSGTREQKQPPAQAKGVALENGRRQEEQPNRQQQEQQPPPETQEVLMERQEEEAEQAGQGEQKEIPAKHNTWGGLSEEGDQAQRQREVWEEQEVARAAVAEDLVELAVAATEQKENRAGAIVAMLGVEPDEVEQEHTWPESNKGEAEDSDCDADAGSAEDYEQQDETQQVDCQGEAVVAEVAAAAAPSVPAEEAMPAPDGRVSIVEIDAEDTSTVAAGNNVDQAGAVSDISALDTLPSSTVETTQAIVVTETAAEDQDEHGGAAVPGEDADSGVSADDKTDVAAATAAAQTLAATAVVVISEDAVAPESLAPTPAREREDATSSASRVKAVDAVARIALREQAAPENEHTGSGDDKSDEADSRVSEASAASTQQVPLASTKAELARTDNHNNGGDAQSDADEENPAPESVVAVPVTVDDFVAERRRLQEELEELRLKRKEESRKRLAQMYYRAQGVQGEQEQDAEEDATEEFTRPGVAAVADVGNLPADLQWVASQDDADELPSPESIPAVADPWLIVDTDQDRAGAEPGAGAVGSRAATAEQDEQRQRQQRQELSVHVVDFQVTVEPKPYVAYRVSVSQNLHRQLKGSYLVLRRFSQFKTMHQKLYKMLPRSVRKKLPKLPSTGWRRSFDPKHISKRRSSLDEYIVKLVEVLQSEAVATTEQQPFISFLSTTAEDTRLASMLPAQGPVARASDVSLIGTDAAATGGAEPQGANASQAPTFGTGSDPVQPLANWTGVHISLITEQRPEPGQRVATHVGIGLQRFVCGTCGGALTGKKGVRWCEYTELYHCNSCCSRRAKMCLPTRVLHHWDFLKYRVCDEAADFLEQVRKQPVLCVSALNPKLFDWVSELRHTRLLRLQLLRMKDFVDTCRQGLDLRSCLDERDLGYLMDNTEMYSLRDLYEVSRACSALGVCVPFCACLWVCACVL